jgi:uncharacterized membrane protein
VPDWIWALGRLPWVALLVFAAIHAIARNPYPLWFDELFTAYWVAHPQEFLWGQGRIEETNPPLYFAIVALQAKLFGTSEAALRFPSLIAGALAVVVAILLGGLEHAAV